MPYPREIQKGERFRKLILALVEVWEFVRDFFKPKKKGRLP